ncbi:C209A protein, partial [Polypterus senegalus]
MKDSGCGCQQDVPKLDAQIQTCEENLVEVQDFYSQLCSKYVILQQRVPDNLKLADSGHLCQACPMNWIQHKKKCFSFNTERKTWSESETTCENLGGTLAILETQEEHSAGYRDPEMTEGQDLNTVLQAMNVQLQAAAGASRHHPGAGGHEGQVSRSPTGETRLAQAAASSFSPDGPSEDADATWACLRGRHPNEWQRSERGAHPGAISEGTSQVAYYDLPEEEAANYDLLKPEILARYGISPASRRPMAELGL